jgi:DNA-binding MarR family transcriptional regulator
MREMIEPVASSEPEPRISYVVARLERALRVDINERVGPHGLTTAQYTTLSILERGGELSNAQLARRACVTPQSMSEVLEALEAKGLVERAPHPTHRRVFPAALTDRGRDTLVACEVAVDDLEHGMLAELSPDQVTLLRTGLIVAVGALTAGFQPSLSASLIL